MVMHLLLKPLFIWNALPIHLLPSATIVYHLYLYFIRGGLKCPIDNNILTPALYGADIRRAPRLL